MPLRVAVLYGGRSGEHEISLRSAEAILAGLDPAKYEVQRILIDKEGRWEPRAISPEPGANPGIDVVFPVLHGTFGEDGTIQGLLELAGLPYVGAGVLATAVCMDKVVLKRLLSERGIPVVEYAVLARGECCDEETRQRLGFPMFVKPANLGSSVGISKVSALECLGKGYRTSGAVRPQNSVRTWDCGPRIRVRRAGQRESSGGDTVRDPSFARILRLRR